MSNYHARDRLGRKKLFDCLVDAPEDEWMNVFSKVQWAALIGLITLFSVLSFYESLDNPLVFDDVGKIVDNPDIQLPEFRLSDFIYPYDEYKLHNRNDPSRPLTFMMFRAAWQMGQGEPWPFHLLSLIIHGLSALLLAILAARLAGLLGITSQFLPAVIASLWYLTLPLNAGTVIYAYGMSDVLATMFMLMALLLVIQKNSYLRIAAACAIYLMALASKQSAIVLPGLVVAIDFFTHRDFSFIRRRMPLYIGLALVSVAYLVARLLYFGRIGDAEAFDQFRVSIYFPLQGIMHWEYVARIFLPINLAIEHAQTPAMYTYPQCFLTWAIITIVAAASLWFGRTSKWLALVALGWCCLFISLSPTSTFFTTTDLFVERRAYTPVAFAIMAWAVLLGGGLSLLQGRTLRIWSLVLVFLFAVNVYVTRERVRVYGDEEVLWKEVLNRYPRDERAMVNLTTYFLRVLDFKQAEEVLTGLLKMYPGYYSGLINMGALYQHPSNPKRNLFTAESYYKQALVQEPNNLSSLMNSGLLALDMGKLDDARTYFGRIVMLNPKIAGGHFGLARTEYTARNFAKSKQHVLDTLRLAPEFPHARELLKILK